MNQQWDLEADVIVVGSGFAGLAAAIEARQAGASVLILEKMKGYGGNSIISEGWMAAAATTLQQQAGIEDSSQRMFEDMLRAGLELNQPELAQTVATQSGEVFRWLKEDMGVPFMDQVRPMGGHSVIRGHAAVGRGASMTKGLLRKCLELGLEVRKGVRLESFISFDAKEGVGMLVRERYRYPQDDSGIVRRFLARKAVILATGGFADDIPMRMAQDPRLTSEVASTNKACTTGEGLRAALRAGAAPVHLSRIQMGPWGCPDEQGFGEGPDFTGCMVFPYGLLVDPATGRRFVNEQADRRTRADAILATGHNCIGIADEAAVRLSGYSPDSCLKKGLVQRFETLAELAVRHGIPVVELEESVQHLNRTVETGQDQEWGRPVRRRGECFKPPYYAIRVWPKVHHTMGGVRIDVRARVLDLDGEPIPGLYAAGEVTGGIHGASRLGGCAITECLVFGRIAGENAAN